MERCDLARHLNEHGRQLLPFHVIVKPRFSCAKDLPRFGPSRTGLAPGNNKNLKLALQIARVIRAADHGRRAVGRPESRRLPAIL
jgi:hypothetical protein